MFFPPIPTRIYLSGNISLAQRYISFARKILFELKRDSTWDSWNTVPSGQRERFLDDGTRIRVTFNYGLTNIEIYTKGVRLKKPKQYCKCCVDCLLIGEVTSDTTIFEDTRLVNISMCQVVTTYIAFENIPIADANVNLKKGDRVIVYATPVLQKTGTFYHTTNLRTVYDYRPAKIWQFFNCMQSDNADDIENDLTDVGLDNQVYTESSDVCNKAGQLIIVDPEEDPPEAVPLRFFMTSIKANKCLVL